MSRNLADIPSPEPPERFVVRPITPGELPERVRVHRSAWEPSRVTEASYKRLTGCWPYRYDLDWIVELDGTFASFCLAWLDEMHEVGELEPVGTDPRFRHLGVGRAACLGAMGALRELGARTAIVYARGDEAYPIPARMYRGLGFETYARTWTYRRSLGSRPANDSPR
jgi:ribosomal protein S18 acetylase RimI-like enzyme